jgi:RNA polymerase sigma factor (sigma-70 family)
MCDWDQIVGRFGPFVYTTACRVLGCADEAEEVVEEVFREARGVGRARKGRAWGPVLSHLAADRALDRLRRGRESWPRPEHLEEEAAYRLRQGLAELPRREATVFALRYFGDLTHEQIAEACQLPAAVVAAALHQARSLLVSLVAVANGA